MSLDYLGAACQACGYSRCSHALIFHHRDPAVKKFSISDYGRSWERLRAELDKCLLLCANCHAETHAGLLVIGK